MTGPKKRVQRPSAALRSVQGISERALAQTGLLPVCVATPPILTDEESIYLSAYRAMDDEARRMATRCMQRLAKEFPRGPRLRLVAAPSR